ncbi:hypothetical protein L596_010175 [Steinernema carpocapsae]|uniref:Uncharacterized protein n=1 Tax=Steinernema carpocapsae TaxID=34508 RepID=A0A4U5PIB7_STECR|nr:hypothetical protein L596_010175 [Steinernema carpocapsae]
MIYSSGYHKRALIKTQVYSEHQLHAARIGKNMSDYHFIFEYRNLTELEKYFDKKMDRDKLSHHYCYLRPIRRDLGELPHGFMLPEVERMKLLDPSIITTTMRSRTEAPKRRSRWKTSKRTKKTMMKMSLKTMTTSWKTRWSVELKQKMTIRTVKPGTTTSKAGRCHGGSD